MTLSTILNKLFTAIISKLSRAGSGFAQEGLFRPAAIRHPPRYLRRLRALHNHARTFCNYLSYTYTWSDKAVYCGHWHAPGVCRPDTPHDICFHNTGPGTIRTAINSYQPGTL